MKLIRVGKFIISADHIIACQFEKGVDSQTGKETRYVAVQLTGDITKGFYNEEMDEFVRQLDGMPK